MERAKFNLLIVNSTEKTEKIDWLFRTIKDATVKNLILDDFLKSRKEYSENQIFIFNLSNYDFSLLDFFKEISERVSIKNVFFLIDEGISKCIKSLAKIGFKNFYYYPEDEFVLRNDVIEQIEILKRQKDFEKNIEKVHKKFSFESLIGTSPVFLECIQVAKRVATKSDSTVLLLGETGTGKEMFAKAIHYNSERSEFPFIELNTSAINENLFEAELFGYEKGAFTDAKTSKPGLLEIAEKGTVFLDEIGDLSLNLQVKLLRAIENKTIRRVGGLRDININCRIIAATNQNLEKLIEEKKFRKDLYYRLKVISIQLPPLRERKEDIIPLSEHFIRLFNYKYDSNVEGLSQKAKQLLVEYDWPGNIRELSNVIERAVLLSDNKTISEKDILQGFSPAKQMSNKKLVEIRIELEKANIKNVMHHLALEVLKRVDGNKSAAARILGISRPKLLKILNEND